MKIILAMLTSVFLVLSFTDVASAESSILKSVHSQATINIDGTVDIEQKWVYDDIQVNDDTSEHSIDIRSYYGYRLAEKGFESITDYEVYHNGVKMKLEENWNSEDSFSSKAGKYGMIEVTPVNHTFIFGTTDKALNEYTVKYKVHNAIRSTRDNRSYKYLNLTFLPTELKPSPEEMTAEIVTTEGVTIDRVYGFKYEGVVGFVNGSRDKVFAEWDGTNYEADTTLNVFTLFRDEKDLITNTNSIRETLRQVVNRTLTGSGYDMNHFDEYTFETIPSSIDSWWMKPASFLLSLVVWLFPISAVLVVIYYIKTVPLKEEEEEGN